MTQRSAAAKEEVVREFRERELLEGARRVIAKHGFQGTTVERVADEAKVAKGTVYLYFANKEELLHAAVLDGLRAMTQELSRCASGTGVAPLERVKLLIRELFRILNSNEDFVKALLLEPSLVSIRHGDPLAGEMMEVFKDYLNFLAEILREAIEAGEVRRVDPQLGAFMLDELVTGSLRRRMLGLTSTPLEQDREAVLELFLKGIEARR